MISLTHPKTGVVREVEATHANKIRILKRAGFIPSEDYVPPKSPEEVVDPSVSDVVAGLEQKSEDEESVGAPEPAVHVSSAARKLILDNDLNPALIEPTGRGGTQITKGDVKKYMKSLEEEEKEVPPQSAEDLPTHDDPEPPKKEEEESEEEEVKEEEVE